MSNLRIGLTLFMTIQTDKSSATAETCMLYTDPVCVCVCVCVQILAMCHAHQQRHKMHKCQNGNNYINPNLNLTPILTLTLILT